MELTELTKHLKCIIILINHRDQAKFILSCEADYCIFK